MKLKMDFLGFLLILVSLIFFSNEKGISYNSTFAEGKFRGIWRQGKGYYNI